MRRLYFSIVLSVIGALFIINWGLDKLVAKQTPVQETSELVIYKQLLEGFSLQVSKLPEQDIAHTITEISKQFHLNLSVESSANIALPPSLNNELSKSGGLLLATEQEAYLLKAITGHPRILLHLDLPKQLLAEEKVNVLFTVVLYVGICGILLLWLLPLTRRIFLLTSTAAKIGAGDLSARVPASQFSYIPMLESSMNIMASRIEKLVADNKILARSLSHDIRTPMSCLRFGIDAALDTTNVDKKNQYLQRMDSEITLMENMTSAFLEYAGMERKGFHLNLESLDMNQLLINVTQDCSSLAEQYNIEVSCQSFEKAYHYHCDYHWCYRALMNLVSNAIQYAKSKVIVSISLTANALIIAVEDDGKGIPKEKRDVIFSPFIKLDADRSREHGHFGLGLAISTKVMGWHQGNIKVVSSNTLSGARFELLLPLQKILADKSVNMENTA